MFPGVVVYIRMYVYMGHKTKTQRELLSLLTCEKHSNLLRKQQTALRHDPSLSSTTPRQQKHTRLLEKRHSRQKRHVMATSLCIDNSARPSNDQRLETILTQVAFHADKQPIQQKKYSYRTQALHRRPCSFLGIDRVVTAPFHQARKARGVISCSP